MDFLDMPQIANHLGMDSKPQVVRHLWLGRTLSLAAHGELHEGTEVYNKCLQRFCPWVLSTNQDCQLKVAQKTEVLSWRCKALGLW